MKVRNSLLVIAALSMLTLTGCNPTTSDADDETTTQEAETDSAQTDDTSDDTTDDTTDSAAVTIPGDGRFAIGTDVPFGGYQIAGDPGIQPDGCTWSILDADGEVQFENQGGYAFLTDVPEFVTFVTDGCPGWEKFE